ncbi:GIY-YIG nuclease family protein [Tessaracoccus sp. OS52]|uniref:GIY-YIG nuclease family protein n=1 Tax=Tessaracoccus sp. OS52 TaxID=2886691 RepID=UPI001D10E930|nr:GIY-YIG nuclease family protein [Tessaracoccus sp. OS52]MCC2592422.1 GIY-YIG nuclease family protein [Tessaracoccus sp. OS52]
MPWVYILQCRDDSYYVGSTRNLEARVEQHMNGLGAKYTSRRLPVKLVWATETDNVGEAFELEKKIQKWSRAKRLALIEGRYGDLPGLSRSKYRRDE